MSSGDSQLLPVLHRASDGELAPLVEYITNAFSNSLEGKKRYKAHYPMHSCYIDLIADELCKFGGNTAANWFRGHGPEWKSVVMDVANKLDAKYMKDWDVERIELAVLVAIASKAWSDMDKMQRKALLDRIDISQGGAKIFPEETVMKQLQSSCITSLVLASLITDIISSLLFRRTVAMGASSVVSRGVASIWGCGIVGLWGAFDLAGPAFRVTIPAVVQVALIRQRIHATTETDKMWQEYYCWQNEKDADSWVANMLRIVGLHNSASVRRERDMAFDQGVEAGRTQATEEYIDQITKKKNEVEHFEKCCEAMLGIAFACAKIEGIALSEVHHDIETFCMGMMGGHISKTLQSVVNHLMCDTPDLRASLAQAMKLGIPEADTTMLMTILREEFSRHLNVH